MFYMEFAVRHVTAFERFGYFFKDLHFDGG